MVMKEPGSQKDTQTFYDDAEKTFDYVGTTDGDSALVFISDKSIREKIAEELKKKEWFVVETQTAQEALRRMRFHTYTLLVIDDFSDETASEKHELINLYLTNTPMFVRRKTFVALISKRLRTMDKMTAWNHGVNFIINEADLHDFTLMINNSLNENEWFYSTFTDVLKHYGKG
jgi:DNA-binding response OmpR family regulator